MKLLLLVFLLSSSYNSRRSVCSGCSADDHECSGRVDNQSTVTGNGTTVSTTQGSFSGSPTVIVSVTCVAVVFLCLLSVVILLASLLFRWSRKKERLSCEAIAAQKTHNIQTTSEDEGKRKKKKDDVWCDDIISPPLPARTAEMFQFDSFPSSEESYSSSSTVTVVVDVEESPDSSGTRSQHNSQEYDSGIDSPNPGRPTVGDGRSSPKMAHSYENTHTPPSTATASRYENITTTAPYENVPDPSHSQDTPPPPPIPPRPHSNKTHPLSNTITSPRHTNSQTIKFTDTHESSNVLPQSGRNHGDYVIESLDEDIGNHDDTTSEESLDLWPPPIPRKTEEMFFTGQMAQGVELDEDRIHMRENVAYKKIKIKRKNFYVTHGHHEH